MKKQALIKCTTEMLHGLLGLPESVEIEFVSSTETDKRDNIFFIKIKGDRLFDVVEGCVTPWMPLDEVIERYSEQRRD